MTERNGGQKPSACGQTKFGQTSNFEWRSASEIQSVAFDAVEKRVYFAEADEGKLTTLDVNVQPVASQLKFKDQIRLNKYKTLLKGIEDSRLLRVIPIKNYIALELVQANYQTYLVFTDRKSGEIKGSYHYQKEVKSGFIFLDEDCLRDVSDDSDSQDEYTDEAPETGQNCANQPILAQTPISINKDNQIVEDSVSIIKEYELRNITSQFKYRPDQEKHQTSICDQNRPVVDQTRSDLNLNNHPIYDQTDRVFKIQKQRRISNGYTSDDACAQVETCDIRLGAKHPSSQEQNTFDEKKTAKASYDEITPSSGQISSHLTQEDPKALHNPQNAEDIDMTTDKPSSTHLNLQRTTQTLGSAQVCKDQRIFMKNQQENQQTSLDSNLQITNTEHPNKTVGQPFPKTMPTLQIVKNPAGNKLDKGKRRGVSGLLCIIEHGLQSFIMHLNPWTMTSMTFPLNRNHDSACLAKTLTMPDSLRLIDIGSSSMFAIMQDSKIVIINQFVSKNASPINDQSSLQLSQISYLDFSTEFGKFVGAGNPVISELVPLNRTDTLLVTIDKKRYFVYDYLKGCVLKEILPIRGSLFKACPDWQFDFIHKPWIILYNSNSIRRVDIQTFEVKKSVDVSQLSSQSTQHQSNDRGLNIGLAHLKKANDFKYPPRGSMHKNNLSAIGTQQNSYASNRNSSGYQSYPNQRAGWYGYYGNYGQNMGQNRRYSQHGRVQASSEPGVQLDIQDVLLMPKMKFDKVEEDLEATGTNAEAVSDEPKTTIVFKQLGQITIALPQAVPTQKTTHQNKNQQELAKQSSLYANQEFESQQKIDLKEPQFKTSNENNQGANTYMSMQMNKEQRALFQAGVPLMSVKKQLPVTMADQTDEVKALHEKKTMSEKMKAAFSNSILENGQRLLVIVGKDKRMIKII